MQQVIDNSTTGWYDGIRSIMEVSMADCERVIDWDTDTLCGKPAKYAVLETALSDEVWVRYCKECYDRYVGLPVPKRTGQTRTMAIDLG